MWKKVVFVSESLGQIDWGGLYPNGTCEITQSRKFHPLNNTESQFPPSFPTKLRLRAILLVELLETIYNGLVLGRVTFRAVISRFWIYRDLG